MKKAVWLTAGAVVVLLLGCGQDQHTETAGRGIEPMRHIDVTLDGFEGAENVGVLMAEELGFFADVGLEVTILSPGSPVSTLQYVANRVVDFGVTHQPQLVLARQNGAPVIAVGALVKRPTAAMIWLQSSDLDGLADLKGKSIAIRGLRFEKELLRIVLKRAGVSLHSVNVKSAGNDLLPYLSDGRADAIFGGFTGLEGAVLEARGLRPVIRPVRNLGVPSYDELVMIARRDRVAREPNLIRDFMSSIARGTAAAIADPEAARRASESGFEANPELDHADVEAAVEATLPVLSENGYMNPMQARRLIGWMAKEGLLAHRLPASSVLTNAYLNPGS